MDVVVAEQMKKTVNDQALVFLVKGMTNMVCLSFGRLVTDYQVTQRLRPWEHVHKRQSVLYALQLRKREYIGGLVFFPPLKVQRMDFGVGYNALAVVEAYEYPTFGRNFRQTPASSLTCAR